MADGEKFIIVDSASRATAEKYNCPQCKRLLRNAVQPSCGHWLCEECAKGLFTFAAGSGAKNFPTCPRPDCGERLGQYEDHNYFPDRRVRKEISNLKVRCCGHDNGCSWTGKLKEYQDHFKQCVFVTTECEFCGHAVHIQEMTSHLATCPKAGKLCPLVCLGCTAGRMSAPQLEKHCVEFINKHFECLSAAVKDLQVQEAKEQRNIPEEDEGEDSAYGSSYKCSRNPHGGDHERGGDYDSGYGSLNGRKMGHQPIESDKPEMTEESAVTQTLNFVAMQQTYLNFKPTEGSSAEEETDHTNSEPCTSKSMDCAETEDPSPGLQPYLKRFYCLAPFIDRLQASIHEYRPELVERLKKLAAEVKELQSQIRSRSCVSGSPDPVPRATRTN